MGFLDQKKIRSASSHLLEPYKVKMHSVDQPISSLSGGNQQKVVVAREVSLRRPKFLIASQPTRGVDVGANEFIHRQILDLRDAGAGVLLVSSELDELCSLSDRICVLFEGRAAAFFEGPQFDVKEIGRAMTDGGHA